MTDEIPQPVAYCAPGNRAAAAFILAARGETVREIREHPWLEGFRDVLVCTPPEEVPLPYPVTPREPILTLPSLVRLPSPLTLTLLAGI